MHALDWYIILSLLAAISVAAAYTRKYSKSVADFLAANRCAGRYLLSTAEGVASTGAIYIIALFEMYYLTGFVSSWWFLMTCPFAVIIATTGWVIYRFRETRALTMAQFLEIRYSKRFRIFMGLLAWGCGVLNFGIFPAVGARFFIYFCGIPENFLLCGVYFSSFAVIMFSLITLSIILTFLGGQITIIVTDFIQGVFSNCAYIILLIVIFRVVGWDRIGEVCKMAGSDTSMINPFHTSQVKDFNIWFFLVTVYVLFYCHLSWQGAQGFNCSALTPHEAKMGKILTNFRSIAQSLVIMLLPICAYVVMHHPDFSGYRTEVTSALSQIDNPQIQKQMTAPVALSRILPAGFMGIFCGLMLAAFISSHQACLHSWGSIFIQDVIIPFRKKPLDQEQHIFLLRASILFVAIFVFLWSLFFKQTTHIFYYFAVTGTIYLGGSGAAIIGGLYWKRGTTAAAWTAMIVGAIIGITGIVIYEIDPDFPVNGQIMWFIGMASSAVAYIGVSLLGPRKIFDMDCLLHRGKYAVAEDKQVIAKEYNGFFQRLGLTAEFTRWDKVIFFLSLGWTLVWSLVFLGGVVYNLIYDVKDDSWLAFWKVYVVINAAAGLLITIWLTIGGLKDIKALFARLHAKRTDEKDDGSVSLSQSKADTIKVCSLKE